MDRNLSVVTGGLCGLLMLAGCVEGASTGSSRPETAATAAADRPAATGLVERDVEAPEVFQRTEAALWDGRPSLGGIWVAHPDVTDPERVIIRNTANGQTIIGALFRRERENPGPRIQVSSDAAAALGLIAGAPTQLNVTALKRTEPAAPEPEPEPAEEIATANAEAADDPVADAGAAIARAEDQTPANGDTEASELTVASADGAGSSDSDAAEPERRRRGGFLAGLFGARAASEPLSATAQPAAAALETPAVTTVALDAPIAEAAPAEDVITPATAPAQTAAAAEPEPTFADPEIAVPAAEPASRPRGGFLGGLFAPRASAPLSALNPDVIGAADGASGVEDAPAPAPATRGTYLEIGTFPTRSDADRAAAAMRQAGIIPLVDERQSADASAWRVLVGPAISREDRTALLHKVKGLGYEDTSVVRR